MHSRIFEYSYLANYSTRTNKMYSIFANTHEYSWVIPVRTPQVHCIYNVLRLTVLLYSCYTLLSKDYRVFSNEWTSHTSKLSVWTCPKPYISDPETLNEYSNIYVPAKSMFTFEQISPKRIFVSANIRFPQILFARIRIIRYSCYSLLTSISNPRYSFYTLVRRDRLCFLKF